jgi:hypothetical protein
MRWSVWIAAAGAIAISSAAAHAQYGAEYNRGYGQYSQPYGQPGPRDIGASPRPDFPGAKQSDISPRRTHKHRRSAAK